MRTLLIRRRTGLTRDVTILIAVRGDFRGLRVPGPVSAGTRWHARLDVVLLPGELRVAGNGGIWRYRVPDMVQVSADPDTPGAIRVEFLEGDPLVVTVRDGGALLGALKWQLEGYERALRSHRGEAARLVSEHVVDGRFTTPVFTITPAIDLLNAQRKGDGGTVLTDQPAPEPRERAHRARVEILRARRRDLLSVGGTGR
jgi:hypothetical protein